VNIGPPELCQRIAQLPATATGQDFEMNQLAFITVGDDRPPAACVQQPAAELRIPAATVGRYRFS
jgi:hypothetical protein